MYIQNIFLVAIQVICSKLKCCKLDYYVTICLYLLLIQKNKISKPKLNHNLFLVI